mgnify:CR=1 FL=1
MSILSIYNKLSMKRKMLFLFSLAAIVPLIIVSTVSTLSSNQYLKRNMYQQVEQSSALLNSNINLLLDETISSSYFENSYIILDFLNSNSAEELYSNSKDLGLLMDDWRSILQLENVVEDVTVVSLKKYGYSDRNGLFEYENITEISDLINTIFSKPYLIHSVNNVFDVDNNSFTLAYPIQKMGTNVPLGIILISYDESYILELLKSSKLFENEKRAILNKSGEMIISESIFPEKDKLIYENIVNNVQVGDKITSIQEKSLGQYIVYSPLDSSEWILLVSVPIKELFQPTKNIIRVTTFTLFLAVIIVYLFVYPVTNSISKPISLLYTAMSEATKGNLDISLPDSNQLEIKHLFNNFNTMVNSINVLMKTMKKEQENLRIAELKALQAQINPHFLYNSIDGVVWSVESGNNKNAIELLIALSNFYKHTLSKGREIVSLSTEFEHAKSYLQVVHMRYQDIFDYSFDLSNIDLNILFPKIILQPIIENAIYHGIKNKRYPNSDKGHITIKIVEHSKYILKISIIDNGIGIKSNDLDKLNKAVHSNDLQQKNFGLRNVNQRIKLFFGKEYGVNIISKHNVGTTVEITIPSKGNIHD